MRSRKAEMRRRRGKKEKMEKSSIPRPIARTSSGTGTESPSVYLVVSHQVTRPAYSVFKVNPFPAGGGGGGGDDDTPVPLPRRVARLNTKHLMCFVPMCTRRHGPWIVGVGGNSARDYGPETIVFDTKTSKAISGPKPLSTKLVPVLVPLGDRIYALARNPSFSGDLDFVPWFEVLDLSLARVDDDGGCLVDCEWKPLPRPPFFPWELTPIEYMSPPHIAVKSHVAVGSYILLSVTGQRGTHIFDVEIEQWAKLGDKDLPFIGGAIPHGTLFLGLSSTTEQFTAYKIKVCPSTVASPGITTGCLQYSLSIVEIQIATEEDNDEEIVNTGELVSLGSPGNPAGFCSLTCCNDDPLQYSSSPLHTKELLTIRTYTIQDYPESAHALFVSNQWKQVYRVQDPHRCLSWPCLEGAISF